MVNVCHNVPGDTRHNQDMYIAPMVWHSGVLEPTGMGQIFRSVTGLIDVLNTLNLLVETRLSKFLGTCNIFNSKVFWIEPTIEI
jgi:hypothetical protein